MNGQGTARAIGMALGALLLLIAAAEYYTRSHSAHIAQGTDDVSTQSGYTAKLEAVRSVAPSAVAILGDSVGLGDTLAKHGVRDWRECNLEGELHKQLPSVSFVNLSGNGLRPADLERAHADLSNVGVKKFLIVVGVRGFSQDFEPESSQYEYPWRRDTRSLAARFLSAKARHWQTIGAVDLRIRGSAGGALADSISRWRAASRPPNEEEDLLLVLQASRRFASALVSESRFQTRALRQLLARAAQKDQRVTLVYATENPDYLERLMPESVLQEARKGIAAVARDFPSVVTYLGPDETMDGSFFLDFVHPNVEGYAHMARRIAPFLQR